MILAQAANLAHVVGFWAMVIVGIAMIVALTGLALQKLGVAVPDFVVKAFWILVVGLFIIAAIKLVLMML